MEIRHGITGNYYAFSENIKEMRWVCKVIGKSVRSIYYSEKYGTYAIRVKRRAHKNALKQIAENDLYLHREMLVKPRIKGKKKG